MQQLRACCGGAARKNCVQLGRGYSAQSRVLSTPGLPAGDVAEGRGRAARGLWERGLQCYTRRHGPGEEGRAQEWPGHCALQGGQGG